MVLESPLKDTYFSLGKDKEFNLVSKAEAEAVWSIDPELGRAAARPEELPQLHELGRPARRLRKIDASTESCEQW